MKDFITLCKRCLFHTCQTVVTSNNFISEYKLLSFLLKLKEKRDSLYLFCVSYLLEIILLKCFIHQGEFLWTVSLVTVI
jgi:hypothetical protein